jgi:hypothetical protein
MKSALLFTGGEQHADQIVVGLDVHRETIAISVAEDDRSQGGEIHPQ